MTLPTHGVKPGRNDEPGQHRYPSTLPIAVLHSLVIAWDRDARAIGRKEN